PPHARLYTAITGTSHQSMRRARAWLELGAIQRPWLKSLQNVNRPATATVLPPNGVRAFLHFAKSFLPNPSRSASFKRMAKKSEIEHRLSIFFACGEPQRPSDR